MKTAAPATILDASAVSLSGFCLIHCLALPVLAAIAPFAGVIAEAEWIHRAFVVAALPVSGYVMLKHGADKGGAAFPVFVGLGLALLCAAAFAESLHDVETVLTSLGAVIIHLV